MGQGIMTSAIKSEKIGFGMNLNNQHVDKVNRIAREKLILIDKQRCFSKE